MEEIPPSNGKNNRTKWLETFIQIMKLSINIDTSRTNQVHSTWILQSNLLFFQAHTCPTLSSFKNHSYDSQGCTNSLGYTGEKNISDKKKGTNDSSHCY